MNKIIAQIKENELFIKYNNFFVPAFCFLVCIILIIFVIIPQIQDYLNAQSEEQRLNQRILQLSQKKQVLDSIDVDLYKSNLEVAMNILPSDQDIPGAVGDLLILLSSNRLKLNGVSLSGSDTSMNGAKGLIIKIETEGDPQSIKNFINSMGDTVRLMRIGRIETVGGFNAAILASFDVAAYYEPVPIVSNSLDAPVSLPTREDLEYIERIRLNREISIEEATTPAQLGKDNPFE